MELQEIKLLNTPQEVTEACLQGWKEFDDRLHRYGLTITPEAVQRWWLRKVETIEGDLPGGTLTTI